MSVWSSHNLSDYYYLSDYKFSEKKLTCMSCIPFFIHVHKQMYWIVAGKFYAGSMLITLQKINSCNAQQSIYLVIHTLHSDIYFSVCVNYFVPVPKQLVNYFVQVRSWCQREKDCLISPQSLLHNLLERASYAALHASVREDMITSGFLDREQLAANDNEPTGSSARRCHVCPKRRLARKTCPKCGLHTCADHLVALCITCSK